jgi:hypothetical protein
MRLERLLADAPPMIRPVMRWLREIMSVLGKAVSGMTWLNSSAIWSLESDRLG